ncbi:MAG TPA: hypothetical protein VKQ30_24990 [Ktedonobacterales bacterium]|nr:hypothetical protein [Ktedonobacterales bacterium]
MANSDRRRITNLLGAGTLAEHFNPLVLAACVAMGAAHTLSTYGVAEFNRATKDRLRRPRVSGVVEVSPPLRAIRTGIGFAGDDRVAEANRSSWEPLATRMVARVVRTTEKRRLTVSQTLWVQGSKSGHHVPAREMLTGLKEHLPEQLIIVKTTLPDDADQRPEAVLGYHGFDELRALQVITAALLTDNASPFALAYKRGVQDQFEAKAIASLLAGLAQFPKNKSFGEIGRSLGKQATFAGWAFWSSPVEFVSEGFSLGCLWPFRKDRREDDTARIAHLVHEAKLATDKAMTEPTAKAIDDEIDLSHPCFIVYTVPVRLSETRAWEAFSSDLRRWLGNTYPTAVPVFASGHGTRHPRSSGTDWLQVSVLFSLPTVPRPIRRILDAAAKTVAPSADPLPIGTPVPLRSPLTLKPAASLDYTPHRDGAS